MTWSSCRTPTAGGSTDLYAKAWQVGTAEPTTWTISTVDSTAALQGVSGNTGIAFLPQGASQNDFLVDNYESGEHRHLQCQLQE